MIKLRQYQILLLLTPVFILLAFYVAGFGHEFSHSTTAWLLGFKQNPLDIIYGGYSWQNLLLLWNVDEKVDYPLLSSQGHLSAIALIAFAGFIGSALMYIITFVLLKKMTSRHKFIYYFILWLNILNLAELFSYIPLRVFHNHGDIGNTTVALNISPWWFLCIVGPLIFLAYILFFTQTLPQAYNKLQISSATSRAFLFIIATYMVLGFPATKVLIQNLSPLPNCVSLISYLIMLFVLYLFWPSRGKSRKNEEDTSVL